MQAAPVAGSTSDFDITSFDGTSIRVHWFPLHLPPGRTAPTVLKGPGWGQPGDTNVGGSGYGLFGDLGIGALNHAGYNVLTWDPRGFGHSGGTVETDSPAFEGRDVEKLIDWVATRPGVQLDAPGDPRLGMVGASYGGGIQLTVAAIDCRVDAIVPQLAWHSLGPSLYDAQTAKIGWGDELYAASNGHSVDPHITSAHTDSDTSGLIDPTDVAWFLSRGPGSNVAKITAPTFFEQGTIDTLFPLEEAVTNYQILSAKGVPTAMLWMCSGHGVCLTKPGDQQLPGTAALAWLARYLKDNPSAKLGAPFEYVDQNGVEHTAAEYPPPSGAPIVANGSGTLTLTAGGGSGPAVATGNAGVLGSVALPITPAKAAHAANLAIPIDHAANVVGAPQLTLHYSGTTAPGSRPTRVFAQLVDDATGIVLGTQITPIIVTLDGQRAHDHGPARDRGVHREARIAPHAAARGHDGCLRAAPPRWQGRLQRSTHHAPHGDGGHPLMPRRATSIVSCIALLGLGACSSSHGSKGTQPTTSSTGAPTTTSVPRRPGPSAVLTALTGGTGVYMGEASAPDLGALGYVQREYAAAGSAAKYNVLGALSGNGRWRVAPAGTAPLPHARGRTSSRGSQAFQRHGHRRMAQRERRRRRRSRLDEPPGGDHARGRRVGRRVGTAPRYRGRARAGEGPERSRLQRRGQGTQGDRSRALRIARASRATRYSYDIYTQVARAVRAGAGLGGLHPSVLIAAGESQSAFALVSYYDGVQPLTQAFDGFFVHSRGAAGLPLVVTGKDAGIANAISGRPDDLPHRPARTRARHPDRDRRRQHPQLLRGPPARQQSLPALGGRGHRARRRASHRPEREVHRLRRTDQRRARCTSSPRRRCTRSPSGSRRARFRSPAPASR